MSNINLLVKNYFKLFLNKLSKKTSKNGKSQFPIVGIALVFGLLFTSSFASLAQSTIKVSIEAGDPTLAIYSFATSAIMLTLMIVVTESSPVRKNSDEELLLSLPFKKYEIVTSKILFFLLFDLIVLTGLLLPSYIIYYFMVPNTSVLLIVKAAILIICATLFATGISNILATLLVRITRKFKYGNIIQSLFTMALMVSFLIVYCAFSFFGQNPAIASSIYESHIVKTIASFILNNNMLNISIIVIVPVVIFIISVIIKAVTIGKNSCQYQSKNTDIDYCEKSIKHSLFKKEINRYFSTPIYLSNTAFGAIFVIMIALVVAIMGKDYFLNIIKLVLSTGYESGEVPIALIKGINDYFNFGLIAILSFVLVVSPTTASSISFEGKELWILKAHPIDTKDALRPKLLVNLLVTGIPSIIISILISTRIGIIYLPISLVIFLSASVFSSCIGLYANLLYPKLVWESEQEIVKQGVSVLASMGINTLCVLLPCIIFFVLPFGLIINLVIISLIFVIIAILSYVLVMTKGVKLFNKL